MNKSKQKHCEDWLAVNNAMSTYFLWCTDKSKEIYDPTGKQHR